MKAKIERASGEKRYAPFTVSITLETVQEARALFHMFNCKTTLNLIRENENYFKDYIDDYTNIVSYDNQIIILIYNELYDQGFKI